MLKKLFSALCLLLLMTASSFAVNGQVIVVADADPVIPAVAGRIAVVQAMAVIATSTTSTQFNFYNGDNYLLGDATRKLTVDLDGIDGPMGFVLPYNEQGWFQADTVNEAIQMHIDPVQPVIVVLTYRYIVKTN